MKSFKDVQSRLFHTPPTSLRNSGNAASTQEIWSLMAAMNSPSWGLVLSSPWGPWLSLTALSNSPNLKRSDEQTHISSKEKYSAWLKKNYSGCSSRVSVSLNMRICEVGDAKRQQRSGDLLYISKKTNDENVKDPVLLETFDRGIPGKQIE